MLDDPARSRELYSAVAFFFLFNPSIISEHSTVQFPQTTFKL